MVSVSELVVLLTVGTTLIPIQCLNGSVTLWHLVISSEMRVQAQSFVKAQPTRKQG